MPQLSRERIDQLSGSVAQYIANQRNCFLNRAANLSSAQKAAMAGFFRPDLLETIRILVLEGEKIGNPDFYPMLNGMGFSNLPDFTQMGAVTFKDVVVFHDPFSSSLLFHELVHVEQYRQLGLPRFAELYVRGFLNGGGYYDIPLEINACSLGRRFEASPRQYFSVEHDVSEWIKRDRF